MALSLQTADAALKDDVQPTVREQLNSAHMLLDQIERNSKDVEGRRAVLSLHVRRNQGVGARAENGPLPTAGQQGYAEERVPLRYNYGRIELSGPVIRAMKSDNGSFVRAVESESRGIVTDLKIDVNRQLWGTADGVIAACGTTTASATVNLAAATTATQMRQFAVGMKVEIGTVASPDAVTSALTSVQRTIVSVNATAKQIVLGAAVTTAGTDRVFRYGSGGSGVNQKELTGIQAIVAASGTLFNVDPTVEPSWVSTRLQGAVPGTPEAPSDARFARLMDEVSILSGGNPGSLLVTSYGVARAYGATLTSQKRFNDTTELKGGWSALQVSGTSGTVSLVADKDAPANKAFLLNTDHLFQHEMSDWEFMDEDGAVLNRVSGFDAYEAVLFKYHELTTDQRNAHAVLEDITEA